MPTSWAQKRKKDFYHRKAKKEKFRSRASYKLFQANKKYRLIKKGDVVVDLGAHPGGWLQTASQLVGVKGLVVGVDLKPIEPFEDGNVHTIIGDINGEDVLDDIRAILPRPADVVISDVSPNVSGVWELDHARQIDLANRSLSLAKELLKPAGHLLVKAFQGSMFTEFLNAARKNFETVRVFKPQASRKGSAEVYVVALRLK